MIKAHEYQPQTIKQAYNRRGWIYSKTVAPMEWEYHLEALEQANLQPGEKVLEVAVGPGLTAVEIARRVGKEAVFSGMDISTSMLALTEQRLRSSGFSQFVLKEGSATQIPYSSKTFDVLYNGYMLDLIPEEEMPGILAEFKRLLKPGGRMILLEHMASDRPWLRGAMNRLNPITVRLLGDNINRQTSRSVELAGLHVESSENLFGDVVRLIVASRWVADS